jgi:hypothetical protein
LGFPRHEILGIHFIETKPGERMTGEGWILERLAAARRDTAFVFPGPTRVISSGVSISAPGRRQRPWRGSTLQVQPFNDPFS